MRGVSVYEGVSLILGRLVVVAAEMLLSIVDSPGGEINSSFRDY